MDAYVVTLKCYKSRRVYVKRGGVYILRVLSLFGWPNTAPLHFFRCWIAVDWPMASQHASYAHIHVLVLSIISCSPSHPFFSFQTLHASLPPFSPLVPTSILPLIAWSLLLSAFSLAFYFTTYVPQSLLPPATSRFPHACRPAASPRRVSHFRKSQSHS